MNYEELISFVEKNLKKTAAKEITSHIAVEFNIYGEGEGAFYVEVNDGKIEVAPYEYYDRDAKIYITAEELVKIVNGEKTPKESFNDGILMIEGNIDSAMELVKLIKTSAKKETNKKTTDKKSTAKKTVKAEKKIVEETKKKNSKVAKDIKK